ncbi:MAG TPA: potassium transporter Kup [Gemmatimonadales bacterium]|nr:potassium transporter Kup [Gemmatimonadales bacterium]
MTDAPPDKAAPRGRYLMALSLGALGIVYGDIGTSPLYALREAFHGSHPVPVTPGNVLGVLSLVFWALVIVVTIKYHLVVIRADNDGEGGILALMALVQHGRLDREAPHRAFLILGLFGSALLYADGALTPAISVMGAVEGLEIATPTLAHWVVPITLVILVALFLFQRRGTGGVGAVFGPVILVWFVTIGALGLNAIIHEPAVLAAVLPWHAVEFFAQDVGRGFLVLGAVYLVVTGGEALYADLGHFGHTAIQIAWFSAALPCLLLNYFGQGALLLHSPQLADNPFYHLAPRCALFPVIVLATAAAIIASQAIISGAFSLTRQAVQLGYSPRVKIQHTSAREIGQVYVPAVNWLLMVATCGLVLGFRSSSNVAGAYGVALSAVMVITTTMFYSVCREIWHWSLVRSVLVVGTFLTMDLAFLAANALKIPEGGWFSLVAGTLIFTVLTTWKRGRMLLEARLRERAVPLQILLGDIAAEPPRRVPGTAVFMTSTEGAAPPALVHNLAHNHVLHERVVLLNVRTRDVPVVPSEERVEVTALGQGLCWITAYYGFTQSPSVPEILECARSHGVDARLEATSFFLGRETLIARPSPGMARWRQWIFAFMSRNAQRATAFFQIPPDQVFEVGVQVEM